MAGNAVAAPADLDPTFGGGGLATALPDAGEGAGELTVLPSGRTVSAFVHGNTVRLIGLTPAGERDKGFGQNGIMNTGIAAVDAIASAPAPGGRLLAGAGAQSATAITVARYLANGSPDSSFGQAGKVTIDLGGISAGTRAAATGLASLPDGRVLVAAREAGPVGDLVAIRLLADGRRDPAFGTNGVARVDAGGTDQALDVAPGPDGDVLLSGASTVAGATDTVVARLTSGGLRHLAFGGGAGYVRLDATASGGSDRGAALTLADGAIFVAASGPQATDRGIVAKLTLTGARDVGFGTNGLVTDALLHPPAAGSASAEAVAVDAQGRVLLGGRFTAPGDDRSNWMIARLAASGANPADAAFGTRGVQRIEACDGRGRVAIRAIAFQPNGRILVAGPCVAGAPVAGVARLFGQRALRGLGLSVSPDSEAAGSESTRIELLPPGTAAHDSSRLQGTPLRSSPLRSSPLRSSPLRSSPLRSSPLRSSPLRSSGLADEALLSELPLRTGDWADYTTGTRYDGAPLYTVTLGNLLDLDPAPAGLDEITLADIALEDSPLRSSSLAALLLDVPLDDLPDPKDATWCDFLSGQPLDCSNGADPASTTLLALERAGDDLTAYYREPIRLEDADIAGTVLARSLLVDVELSATPFGAVPANEAGAVLACGSSCDGRTLAELQASDPEGFSTHTLGDLIALLPLASLESISLGELVPGLLPIEEFPFDDDALPLDEILARADFRAGDLQRYALDARVDCDQIAAVALRVEAPYGTRAVPGSATVVDAGGPARPIGDPDTAVTGSGDGRRTVLSFPLAGGVCESAGIGEIHDVVVRFDAEPPARLGPAQATADADGQSGSVGGASDSFVVDDSRDPGDEPSQAREISAGRLLTGYISSATDLDHFTLAAPPAGSEVTVSLSHLEADLDLHVYGEQPGPDASPLRSSPLRSSPLRSSTLEDNGEQPDAQPDSVQELPLRSSPLRSSSVHRGTTAELARFRTYEGDAGRELAITVSGFNGATAVEPYLLSVRVERPAQPPECVTRPDMSGPEPPALAPIPPDAETLILVNYGRMVARYGQESTDLMLDSLEQLAAHESVNGGILAVDGAAGYAAWDADPCSPEAANAVAEGVRDLLDDATRDLTGLRSIAIVGNDEIIPLVRTPDLVLHANQRDYADELLFRGRDTAIGRAFRTGHLVTDDFYGDYDPQIAVGGLKFTPDVAVGRVVESADDVRRQAERYLAAGGVLDATAASVAGYDFLTDAAREVADGLSPAVGGNVQRLIGESWTAADARDALNAPGARFASVNAHYDHWRALPAAAFRGQSPDLLFASESRPAEGSFLFTIGCQSGLNVPDPAVADLSDPERARAGDWAQLTTGAGSTFGGNTGFGYGDTDVVAYSERVAANVAVNLASRQVTTGQAVMLAKQSFIAGLATPGVYDWKSSMEFQLTGWPMYRVGPDGGVGAPALPPREADSPAPRLSSESRTLTPRLTRHDDDRGTWWSGDAGATITEHDRPVQPSTSVDVTPSDSLRVHGALVESLDVSRVSGVNPVYSRPTIDLSANEPERLVRSSVFPHVLATVSRTATAGGLRDQLVFAAGQFRSDPDRGDGRGAQRLHERADVRVYRSDSADYDPPVARFVAGQVSAGTASFQVKTQATDVTRVLVLFFEDGSSEARAVELQPAGTGLWAGGRPLSGSGRISEFVVQLVDGAGNVGITSRHEARSVDGGTGPFVVFDPEAPASGFHLTNPLVALARGTAPDTLFTRSVDGSAPVIDDGTPFQVAEPADGLHTIVYRGDRGSTAQRQLRIDRLAPTIKATTDRPAAPGGWWDGPVTVGFECADAVSGVASCEPEATVTDPGETLVSGRAADAAGNEAVTQLGVRIDDRDPTVTIERLLDLGAQGGPFGLEVSGTAADDRSGVFAVRVLYTGINGTEAGSVAATLDCDEGELSCRWTARTPRIPPGVYTVTAQAYDRAGNISTAARTDVVVTSG